MPGGKQIAGLGLRASVPAQNPVADYERHRLSPLEGFILSRVDGKTSYSDICAISGVSETKTVEVLRKLHEVKLILAEGEPVPVAALPGPGGPVAGLPSGPPPATRAKRGGHAPAPAADDGKAGKSRRADKDKVRSPESEPPSILASLDDRTSVDPMAVLEGAPGLDEEMKMRILRVHRRLLEIDYFQILGLGPGADKKAIKRAYFAASKEFHPDRYFGKDLGPYHQKLADIFGHCTKAFEHLQDDERRRMYEAALSKKRRRR